MKKITLLLASLFFLTTGKSQDCSLYYAMNPGTKISLAHYDSKEKLTGFTNSEVTSVSGSGATMTSTVHSQNLNAKGKMDTEFDFEISCSDGELFFNMQSMMPANNSAMAGVEGMEVKIEGAQLQSPFGKLPGTSLPEGQMTMSASMSGMNLGTTTMRIYDRKVVAIESITVPAGTFECVKVTESIEMKLPMMGTVKGSSVAWMNPEAGLVKSESFNEKGEKNGTEILQSITH
jgi:hypothetical protein